MGVVNLVGRKASTEEITMKILGLAICFAIMMGAFVQIGLHLFFDLNAALFVLGGAIDFLVMKNDPKNHTFTKSLALQTLSDI